MASAHCIVNMQPLQILVGEKFNSSLGLQHQTLLHAIQNKSETVEISLFLRSAGTLDKYNQSDHLFLLLCLL